MLKSRDVAEQLGLCIDTVQVWAREGRIPFVKLPNGRLRFEEEDVQALLGRKLADEAK